VEKKSFAERQQVQQEKLQAKAEVKIAKKFEQDIQKNKYGEFTEIAKRFVSAKRITGNGFLFNPATSEIFINKNMTGVGKRNMALLSLGSVKRFEVISDQEVVAGFGAGRAIGGAILTGGIGLLAGFTKKNSVISDLRVRLVTDNVDNAYQDIIFINGRTKTDSLLFKSHQQTIEKITGFLENQIGADEEVVEAQALNGKSAIEQVRELKALLDDGILSEDEFQKKKEELLGL
jgi:hypothetical protein